MNLLPFDLDKALAGGKVVTRDGREVKNFAVCLEAQNYPIVGVVLGPDGFTWRNWTLTGTGASGFFEKENPDDLFLAAPDPIVCWVNFYGSQEGSPRFADYFSTEPEADAAQRGLQNASGRLLKSWRLFGRAIRVEIDPGGAE